MTCYAVIDNKQKTLTKYDAASPLGTNPYDKHVFKYIGDGVVGYALGKKHLNETRLSFFVLRKNRPRWAR